MATINYSIIKEIVNEACIVDVDDGKYCTMCPAQLPQDAQYISHTKGENHQENLNKQFQQMIDSIFSLGIFFEEGEIWCHLCKRKLNVAQVNSHVNDYYHKSAIQKQHDGGYWWLKPIRLVDTVNKACIFICDGTLRCNLCESFVQLPGVSQYISHTEGREHISNVEDQLQDAASNLFSRGIILSDGAPYCVLCSVNFSFSDQWRHVNSDKHQRKVQLFTATYGSSESDSDSC